MLNFMAEHNHKFHGSQNLGRLTLDSLNGITKTKMSAKTLTVNASRILENQIAKGQTRVHRTRSEFRGTALSIRDGAEPHPVKQHILCAVRSILSIRLSQTAGLQDNLSSINTLALLMWVGVSV